MLCISRLQERALAKVPPDVRRRQVAHELARAKQYAADAKTSSRAREQVVFKNYSCSKAVSLRSYFLQDDMP